MKNDGLPVAKDVDEYLQRVPGKQRAVLQALRKAIQAAAPGAAEIISYQIPTYKQNGALVHFAAYPNHCSFFVVNKDIIRIFEKELELYKTSGTTIHFTPENPIPATLVKKIVQMRVQQNEGLVTAKKTAARGKK